ncbi:hypothetical protein C8J57DRAFT_1244953 [Mycena rebaudengoi]|nr:hypothetical protein C8J57DRAFT_1244953 [Mycena rebaudengoi]
MPGRRFCHGVTDEMSVMGELEYEIERVAARILVRSDFLRAVTFPLVAGSDLAKTWLEVWVFPAADNIGIWRRKSSDTSVPPDTPDPSNPFPPPPPYDQIYPIGLYPLPVFESLPIVESRANPFFVIANAGPKLQASMNLLPSNWISRVDIMTINTIWTLWMSMKPTPQRLRKSTGHARVRSEWYRTRTPQTRGLLDVSYYHICPPVIPPVPAGRVTVCAGFQNGVPYPYPPDPTPHTPVQTRDPCSPLPMGPLERRDGSPVPRRNPSGSGAGSGGGGPSGHGMAHATADLPELDNDHQSASTESDILMHDAVRSVVSLDRTEFLQKWLQEDHWMNAPGVEV